MQLKWAIANSNPGWTWTSSGMNLTANTWYWFGFTYQNGEVRIYINGILQETINANGTIGDYTVAYNELWIGNRQGVFGFLYQVSMIIPICKSLFSIGGYSKAAM